ncbi:Transposase-like protein, IS1515 [Streptococcus pneumoniae AP200]|nr:Transposase-like protein, IS1515 [Streptococcus pneumoniae AP200]
MFEIRNLSLSFAGRRLLEPTDLIFERGKVYTIYGKSGVGKSSLLNKIGLLSATDPSVSYFFDGKEIDIENKKSVSVFIAEEVAFVFQGRNLIDLFGNCKKCYTIFMETVYDKAQKLNSKNFKLLIGVKKETFQLMLEHLNSAYQIQHRKGGRPRSLPMEDQLIMTLRYLRYYPTQRLLAFDFGVGVATVNAIITWVEDTLRASGSFDLDHLEAPSAAVAIDVTESPIQRPKKTKAKIILVKRNDTP